MMKVWLKRQSHRLLCVQTGCTYTCGTMRTTVSTIRLDYPPYLPANFAYLGFIATYHSSKTFGIYRIKAHKSPNPTGLPYVLTRA
jgi:hypothetical protein